MRRLLVILSLSAALVACPGPEPVCRVGADCASGVCRRDGTCDPLLDAGSDAGPGDSGAGGGDAGQTDAGDAGADGGSDAGTDGGTTGCLPNGDGTIARSEIFTQPGLRATFRVSGVATFDTAGAALADGGRLWDFTPGLAGDQSLLVETQALAGKWFEADYPSADYVSPLGQGTDLLGVFQSTADGLYLQGVASPADGTYSTRLTYTPPVKVYGFPMQANDTWSTDSLVTGRFKGFSVLTIWREVYASTVDRTGDAITPYARFGVLRVRTVMSQTTNSVPTLSRRSFSFVTECFGAVSTVVSTDNEGSTEFTAVKEVRRLSP